ncbi:prolyl oligopeptidase family serine peptidase [Nonomuraea sp. NPDC000554]|uniref:prolyl oligopeptidase family serine peptidase n=1 Tax=Nonomuraea sp. NPDC000554 TaxID=3154259 RepID=UPI00332BBD58
MSGLRAARTYPKTRQVDAVAGVGDAIVDDPYQFLEEDTPQVLSWQAEQNRLARDYIRSWPHFEAVRQAVLQYAKEDWSGVEDEPPVLAGDRWFAKSVPVGQAHAVVRVASSPAEPGRLVVDPRVLTGDDTALITGFSPSPDGRFVVCWISSHGEERVSLHVVDVETGRALPMPSTPRFDSNTASAAWLPDGSGFYCNPLTEQAGRYGPQVVLQHLDGATQLEIGDLETIMILLAVSADGRHVLVIDPVARKPIYTKALSGGAWRPLLRSSAGTFTGTVVDNAFIAITTAGAPRGRLVRIPLVSADDETTWSELVPESTAVLTAVTYRAGVLVLHKLIDTYTRLQLVGLDGADLGEVALPEHGTAGPSTSLMFGDRRPGGSTYVFPFVTFTTARALHELDLETRQLRQLAAPRDRLAGMTTRIERCLAGDGTPLTYHLVHRKDLDLSRPHPVLAHAYGDSRAPWLPTFLGQYRFFLEAGGIYVHPNLRGGGEYGEEFFLAGTLAHKRNTFTDMHAIAEDMISKGITEARRIGVIGESSGGLLAAGAATQRPDLYGVCITRVPILDLLRVVIDPYGLTGVRLLFGDPTTDDGVRHLLTFSPYHLIRSGTSYPAVLLECGESDHRCPAWHSRKTAARLQNSTSSEAPVLLRVWSGTGHDSGIDLDTRYEQLAEWMSFAMMELGLAPTDVE